MTNEELIKKHEKDIAQYQAAKDDITKEIDSYLVKYDDLRKQLGDLVAAGKNPDAITKQIDELEEFRRRKLLVVEALDNQLTKSQNALKRAQDEIYLERKAAANEYKREKVLELLRLMETAYKMAADLSGIERRFNAEFNRDFNRSLTGWFGVPIPEVLSKLDFWLGRGALGNQKLMDEMKAAGFMDFIERKKYLEKAFKVNQVEENVSKKNN